MMHGIFEEMEARESRGEPILICELAEEAAGELCSLAGAHRESGAGELIAEIVQVCAELMLDQAMRERE